MFCVSLSLRVLGPLGRRQGNRGTDFFKLVKGELIVVKDGKKLSEITNPGEYFGEVAAITSEPRFSTIISRGKSIVERYPGDKFPEVIEKYPNITKKLLEINAGRMDHAEKIIINLMNKQAEGKL
jgi:type IV pilus assembly protein PilB